ncbi:isoleucine--tRNA ligase [Methylovirgula sp. 4M-Z18]|uniref:isoleucine--tRNA ligase n=1 Tax=Methylovirgula sp. 4M-Z18 TaxID=2293567 RepID=UPI000E2F4BB5|nr:isoleucine--tRNA ligase [Methylovirgula sp. 4M-Z18]RFB76385.1 isoleucine--tRNA ligase [Methylovirgula sp. 4M-Z18]
MNDTPPKGPDYSQSLYLPQTNFPMRAGLPKKEPELLARWKEIDLYGQLRREGAGRPKFVLHDGPPYANGNIHIGHALNKILKDVVTRSQQMLGKDSNYVPGWDCHGLPIEWKIEEQYRAKGKNKDDVDVVEFRQECRAFAEHWVDVQREEFKRLGVTGDWDHPYLTMTFAAEAQIAREIMKFAANGLLYRGSKPVMWSVVEKTALAEAEIEYEDHTSDMIWAAFPVRRVSANAVELARKAAELSGENPEDIEATCEAFDELKAASIVAWTTTPWTIPGNRAIAYSPRVAYGLYRVTEAAGDNWAKVGALYVIADKLASDVFKAARVERFEKVRSVDPEEIEACAHPLAGFADGYRFDVPLLPGDHVTDDAGTGFVHTAPSHGREDFDVWMASSRILQERRIDTRIPYTVDENGFYTEDAPGFVGKRVLTDKGEKGDANDAVIKALMANGHLVARGRLKHQYPHSWRSKKPVIFRNTPQWFIAMDKPIANMLSHSSGAANGAGATRGNGRTLRDTALEAITETRWVPASGENRINGMIENRPDWVMSRQRAWGVPIAIFVKEGTHEVLIDGRVNKRIADAFEAEGADAWFKDDAAQRFLAPDYDPADYDMVMDVLDVWFDSGSTHSYVLEDPVHFPGLAGIHRKVDGGVDEVMYLEGSDQHRGWFHSSLLESCGTRGRAPFDVVLTHGFVLDEQGRKMSKSIGNVVAPQDIIKDAGSDILRLWVCASDYSDDLRIGKNIMQTFSETYRKLRNTIRWMLGALSHFDPKDKVAVKEMPELERFMLHRLAELNDVVLEAYQQFDYKKVVSSLSYFMTSDLSAFYFDIRKDTLYCDAPSSVARRSALTVIDMICDALLKWLAPILVFTCDEAWLDYGRGRFDSVHLATFPQGLGDLRNDVLAEKWRLVRRVRSVVTGALEIERAQKNIGSSLEAAPIVHIADPSLRAALEAVDFADVCITSDITIVADEGPAAAFRLPEVAQVSVEPRRAAGKKCARSWRYSPLVGSDPDYPDVTPRDAAALRELKALGRWA